MLESRQTIHVKGESTMIRLTIGRSALLAGIILIAGQAPAAQAPPPKIPDFLAAAVADPGRPAADVEHDANRKPAETLEFAGLKPGFKVVELLPGGGYFTRIISKAVGTAGHVYALVPAPRPDAPADAPDFASRVKAIAADPNYSNVSVVVEPFAELKAPEPVDLVWTSQNSHRLQSNGLRGAQAGRHLPHPGSFLGAGSRIRCDLDIAQDRSASGETGGARRRVPIRRQQ
jgi:hypothetical protein